MGHTSAAMPPLDTLAQAWDAWRSVIGVTRIDTPEDYDRVVALINAIIDSEILAGKRAMSKAIAKRLAARFGVHADVFL